MSRVSFCDCLANTGVLAPVLVMTNDFSTAWRSPVSSRYFPASARGQRRPRARSPHRRRTRVAASTMMPSTLSRRSSIARERATAPLLGHGVATGCPNAGLWVSISVDETYPVVRRLISTGIRR